jgi:hypothetical protein
MTHNKAKTSALHLTPLRHRHHHRHTSCYTMPPSTIPDMGRYHLIFPRNDVPEVEVSAHPLDFLREQCCMERMHAPPLLCCTVGPAYGLAWWSRWSAAAPPPTPHFEQHAVSRPMRHHLLWVPRARPHPPPTAPACMGAHPPDTPCTGGARHRRTINYFL